LLQSYDKYINRKMRLLTIVSYIFIQVCIYHQIDAKTGGGPGVDDEGKFPMQIKVFVNTLEFFTHLYPFIFGSTMCSIFFSGILEPDNTSPPPSSVPVPVLLVPSPSPTKTPEPTSFDVFPPVNIPTSSDCQSVDGVYGTVSDDEYVVTYNYAVQLKAGTSESEFTSLLLPDLETAMIDAIIPSLFDCSSRRKHRVLSFQSRRQLMTKIVGINKIPIDAIVDDIACSTIDCFVLLGTLTIYLNTTERRSLQEEQSHYTMVRQALKETMDAGTFNNVSESIINVTWVDDDSDESGVNKPDGNDGDNTQRSTSNNGQVIGWTVGLGAAGLLILLAAAAIKRRRNSATDDQSDFQAVSTTTSA
jgi:hypothetical protein